MYRNTPCNNHAKMPARNNSMRWHSSPNESVKSTDSRGSFSLTFGYVGRLDHDTDPARNATQTDAKGGHRQSIRLLRTGKTRCNRSHSPTPVENARASICFCQRRTIDWPSWNDRFVRWVQPVAATHHSRGERGVSDEAAEADLLLGGAAFGDLGPVAAGRIDQFDRSAVRSGVVVGVLGAVAVGWHPSGRT